MNKPKTFPSLFKVPTAIRREPVKKRTDENHLLNSTTQIKDNFQNLLDDSLFNDIDENVLLNAEEKSQKTAKLNRTYTVISEENNVLPSSSAQPRNGTPHKRGSSQTRSVPFTGMSQRPPKIRKVSPSSSSKDVIDVLDMTITEPADGTFEKLYSPARDPELSPVPVPPVRKALSSNSAYRIMFTNERRDCLSDLKVKQIKSMFNIPPPPIPKPRIQPEVFSSSTNVFSDQSDSFNLDEDMRTGDVNDDLLSQNVNLDLTIDPERMAELLEKDNYIFENEDDPYQSSQKFLHDIRLCETFTQVPSSATKTKKPAAIYMEMQKSMSERNDENVTDDMIHEKETNTQLAHPTQYRRDVETVFDECERSIRLLEGEQQTDRLSQKEKHSDELDDSFSTDLQEINWDDVPKTQASKVVQQVLESPVHVTHLAPVSSSPFCAMGPFFGLPLKVKKLIKEYKGIDELYEWQKECLRLPAVQNRNNLIYALPTSGGKTLVAEILMLREVICRRKNVIFILPYVAIVQEKIWAMSPFAVGLEFLVEEYASGKGKCPPRKRRKKNSIFVATIEKSLALIDSLIEEKRLNEIGLVVVDELHLLGEDGRGATLECVLTKLMFMHPNVQIVGMSATIGNLEEIGQFLNAKLYTRDFRPVELKEYIKCGNDLLEINASANSPEEAYKLARTLDFGYCKKHKQMDPDMIAGLVQEVIPENSCLIFCSTKKNCEDVAALICKIFPDNLQECRRPERNALIDAIIRDTGDITDHLRLSIPYGVAHHHSGLTSDERRLLEDAFRAGVLCVICCTSTLAAGVNLPCKRVIIRHPYIGRSFITQSKYKQMIGRAGRAGMGELGESILICPPKDNINVNNLLLSPMDDANSSMHSRQNLGFRNFMLSAIGLNMAITRNDLLKLTAKTLLAVQSEKLGINVKELTDSMIKSLYKMNALTAKDDAAQQRKMLKYDEISVRITGSQLNHSFSPCMSNELGDPPKKHIIILPRTPLEISQLGRAAFKACIDLQKAHLLYDDLQKAQDSLVLTDYLHLLYLCTPYENCDERQLDWRHYYSLLSRFNPIQYNTAVTIGVDDNCLNRMHVGKPPIGEKKRIIYRFCVTLMLYDLWNNMPIHEVAKKFDVPRGYVQNLMSQAATQSSVNLRFCEELDEFWAFKQLFSVLIERLSYCCSVELVPLMQLPAVKISRAKQLYAAGFKDLDTIAAATPNQLTELIEHLNIRVAKQLVSAAKVLLLEKVDSLREQAQDYLEILSKNK